MTALKTRKDAIVRAIPGESFTPFALAVKLKVKALLESRSLDKKRERYSLLLVTEAFRVVQSGGKVRILRNGALLDEPTYGRDILDVISRIAGENAGFRWDFPFPAGGMGYLSYEFLRFCDNFSLRGKPDPLALPDAEFIFGHVFIIFDHYTDTMLLLGLNYHEHEIDLEDACSRVVARIGERGDEVSMKNDSPIEATIQREADGDAAFLDGVERIRDEIKAGNLLQGVLSRRLYLKTDQEAIDAYRRLRSVNPSPYLFYLDFGHYQLFGASPEVMVKVKNGRAILRPIAGTRRRGTDVSEDTALEKELREDEKEKAEHLMLVDLARNDLGRVCESGSVKVTDFMSVERYSHVMHLVSEVEGRIGTNISGPDVIRAVFPAGTVSGAPKIRAVKVVDSLESEQRRFYAGLVGYLEPDGGLDTCIAIRCGMKKDGLIVLQAGAGIVFDSVPERELEETEIKLAALVKSVGLEVARVPVNR